MGVYSVPVLEALSHANTLEALHALSCYTLLVYCSQLRNPWKDIQAIEAIQRTFTCKITEAQRKRQGKTTQTQIIIPPDTA